MDFADGIKNLAERAQKVKGSLGTEEATKNALVMPFIQVLGYDVFNPHEVVPEFVADIAGRKGEKVDYAIMQDGSPIIIIECKCCGSDLNGEKCDQLHRYFVTLDSSIGILTDGIRYLFFSSGADGKKMDTRPFMEFNLEDMDLTLIPELRKLCKGKFDLKTTLDTVNELKFNRQIKLILEKQLETPSENIVDCFIKETYDGRATARIKELFTGYVKRAFNEFVAEQIDARLKSALAASTKKDDAPPPAHKETEEAAIVTTEEEWQAYYLVKSILMGTIAPERIALRDAISLCNILLDNNVRKPLIKLYFNNPQKLSIELVGENKELKKQEIKSVEDILQFAEDIRSTARQYEAAK